MTINDTMSLNGTAATTQNGHSASNGSDFTVKAGLAQMLKGGVIMDVVNAEQVSAPVPTFGPIPTLLTEVCLPRLALPKKLAPAPSWPLSVSLLISAAMEA